MKKFVTIAIHTIEKAEKLKQILSAEGIEIHLHQIDEDLKEPGIGVRVRVDIADLSKALHIIESRNIFSYSNKETLERDNLKKRILIPVDFSPHSMQACTFAFNLAKSIDAKVKIIHIYFNPFYPKSFIEQEKDTKQYKDIEEKVKENIQRLCNDIDKKIQAGDLPSVNYSYLIKEGLPEEEIVLFADDYKPDLIVMGTRGKNQKKGDLIGRVTANVIEMTHFPLMAIPEGTLFTDFKRIKNICFLSNSSARDLISFEMMIKILEPFDINYIVMHVVTKEEENWDEEKIKNIHFCFSSKYPDLKLNYKMLSTNDLLTGVDEYLQADKIDMLALTTSKRNIFMRMFKPSIPRKMLYHSSIPLFVLRG